MLKATSFAVSSLPEWNFIPFLIWNVQVSLRSAGGGGWGSPLERDPKLVQWDVKNEYITIETARNVYGVVLDPKTLEINMEETKRLREEMKKKGVSSPLNLLIFLRFQRTQCFLF
jgi:hypothetical protein